MDAAYDVTSRHIIEVKSPDLTSVNLDLVPLHALKIQNIRATDHMIQHLITMASAVALTVGTGSFAFAQSSSSDTDVSLTVGAGVDYDSDVISTGGLNPTGSSDYASEFSLGADLKQKLGKTTKLTLKYDGKVSRYFDVTDRDNNLNIGSATLTQKIGKVTLGGNFAKAWYSLDGDAFLEMDRYTGFIGAPGPAKTVLLGSYTYSEKAFDDAAFAFRDADADVFSASVIKRVGPGRFKLNYSHTDEDSLTSDLSFKSNKFALGYTRKLELFSQPLTLDAEASYEDRNYQDINFLIGAEREDERLNFGLDLTRAFDSGFAVALKAGLESSDSNVAAVDYNRTRIGLSVEKTF